MNPVYRKGNTNGTKHIKTIQPYTQTYTYEIKTTVRYSFQFDALKCGQNVAKYFVVRRCSHGPGTDTKYYYVSARVWPGKGDTHKGTSTRGDFMQAMKDLQNCREE